MIEGHQIIKLKLIVLYGKASIRKLEAEEQAVQGKQQGKEEIDNSGKRYQLFMEYASWPQPS